MSAKLDQSLDDIVKDHRATGRHHVRSRRNTRAVKATGPAGGVSKNAKAAKPAKSTNLNPKAAAAAAVAAAKGSKAAKAPAKKESKIVVSGLPVDVDEAQIKDYFGQTIGPVKRTTLTYGPTGQSRGIVTILFNNAEGAAAAVSALHNVKIDNRPIKVEVVVGADQAPAPPTVKNLGERIAQPKGQAKPNQTNQGAKSAPKPAARKARPKRGHNAGRKKPKTTEELDAEMTDYFGDGANGNAAAGQENVAANGNTHGDAGMEDEIM